MWGCKLCVNLLDGGEGGLGCDLEDLGGEVDGRVEGVGGEVMR